MGFLRSNAKLAEKLFLMKPKRGLDVSNADVHAVLLFEKPLSLFNSVLLELTLQIATRRSHRQLAVFNPILCPAAQIAFFFELTIAVPLGYVLRKIQHFVRIIKKIVKFFLT